MFINYNKNIIRIIIYNYYMFWQAYNIKRFNYYFKRDNIRYNLKI